MDDYYQNDVCKKDSNGTFANNFTKIYDDAFSRIGCSQDCPCPNGEKNEVKNLWMSYEEEELNKFGRTKKSWDRVLTPLKFLPENGREKTYTSILNCYVDKLAPKLTAFSADLEASEKNPEYIRLKPLFTFFSEGGPFFVATFENKDEENSCSGVCEKSLFYFGRDFSKGKATLACGVDDFKEIATNTAPASLLLLITGFVLVAWCVITLPILLRNEEKTF